MNQHDFEADLRQRGYKVFHGDMKAGEVTPEHAHDLEYRILVVAGEVTVTHEGKAETYRAGDVLDVSAGFSHFERVGPQGMSYVAGSRAPAA